MEYNNNNNPYRNQNNPYYSQNPQTSMNNPGRSMATVAMVLGLASVFCAFTVYLPMIFGSIGGLAMVIVLITSVFTLLMSNGDYLIDQGRLLDEQFERQTGQKLEDYLGKSYEDIMREYADLFDNL